MLPREDDGVVVIDGVEVRAAQRIWRAARRHRAYSVSLCVSLRAWARARNLRRGNSGNAGKPDLQAAVRSDRSGGGNYFAESGRRGRRTGAEALSSRAAAPLSSER